MVLEFKHTYLKKWGDDFDQTIAYLLKKPQIMGLFCTLNHRACTLKPQLQTRELNANVIPRSVTFDGEAKGVANSVCLITDN